MATIATLRYEPQDLSPAYLDNLACAYWLSEVVFCGVELDLFSLLEPEGKSLEELAQALKLEPQAMERFFEALCALGLVVRCGKRFYNTAIARKYLVRDGALYQGNSIRWKRFLASSWRNLGEVLRVGGRVSYPPVDEDPRDLSRRTLKFLRAMDEVAKVKALTLMLVLEQMSLEGELLDVGAGSGAMALSFLRKFPKLAATLLDLPHVLEHAPQFIGYEFEDRVSCLAADVLGEWPLENGRFMVVMLSNLLHTYGPEEAKHILAEGSRVLKEGGLLIVHDYFREHSPMKAALFDLNMLINTYNGRVYSGEEVRRWLAGLGLYVTDMLPLDSDTAVLFASSREEVLRKLALDPGSHFPGALRPCAGSPR